MEKRVCEKYYLAKNKWLLAAALVAAAVSVPFAGGFLFAAVAYTLLTELCGMRFLGVLNLELGAGGVSRTVGALGVSRRVFYAAYLRMLFLQAGLFAALFAACTLAGRGAGARFSYLPGTLAQSEAALSRPALYAAALCLVLAALAVTAGLVNGSTPVRRLMLLFSTVYLAVLLYILYLLFLFAAQNFGGRQAPLVLALCCGAALAATAAVTAVRIKKSGQTFFGAEKSETN